ncbi:MAG: hypothetical protein IE926_20335 [Micrococcales bacterium]|nr:hypothetical protein [Micrococcales bacterium]
MSPQHDVLNAHTAGQATEPGEHDTAARALIALYDQRCRLVSALAHADHPSAAMVQDCLAKGDELDTACEAFRRSFYPRHAEVFVGLWAVCAASPTRRSITTVLDLWSEYRLEPAGDLS